MGWLDGPLSRRRHQRDGAAADHVRHRRPRRPARGATSTTSRATAGSRAGADRQRRRRPAPARHLRRADRLRLPLQQVRRARSTTTLGRALRDSSTGSARTGTSPTRASGRRAAGARHFVYSRLMCWVAIDRAIRDGRPARPSRRRARLDRRARDDDLPTRSCSAAGPPSAGRSCSTTATDVLDASILLMPLVKFICADRPALAVARWTRIGRRSWSSDSLVYRYDPQASPDGLAGEEGTFSMCSFWYVEALARAGRARRGAARLREDAHLRQPPRALRRGDRAHAASSSATSPRPSPTWRSSAPPTTSTAPSDSAGPLRRRRGPAGRGGLRGGRRQRGRRRWLAGLLPGAAGRAATAAWPPTSPTASRCSPATWAGRWPTVASSRASAGACWCWGR